MKGGLICFLKGEHEEQHEKEQGKEHDREQGEEHDDEQWEEYEVDASSEPLSIDGSSIIKWRANLTGDSADDETREEECYG